jgi:small GTP-binding protein
MCEYKIVVFGSGAVGKSAVVLQFVEGYFITDYEPTIEDSYGRVVSVGKETVKLDILDTAGQDDFLPIRTSYMRQGKGFMIIYAVNDRSSFEQVEDFFRDLRRTIGTLNLPVIICGNKCDLEDKRTVSKEEGQELAQRLSATFIETSARNNTNVDKAFMTLVAKMREMEKRTPQPGQKSAKGKGKKDRQHQPCLLF